LREITKEYNTEREKPHELLSELGEEKCLLAYKTSRFKGGAREVSNVVVTEKGNHFRLNQHRILLKAADMLQQIRAEYSDYAEICPVR